MEKKTGQNNYRLHVLLGKIVLDRDPRPMGGKICVLETSQYMHCKLPGKQIYAWHSIAA